MKEQPECRDALDAPHVTDRRTMQRVLAGLRSQLAGAPSATASPFIGPAEQLEHRTCTLLGPLYAKERR